MLKKSPILPVYGTLRRPTFRNLARIFKIIIWPLVFGYLAFSVILSSIHLFEHLNPRGFRSRKAILPINKTYDTNNTSPLSEMPNEYRFLKLHSASSQLSPDNIFPFYFRSELTPKEDDITVTTFVTQDNYDDLVRLAKAWQGPISAVLHLQTENLRNDDPEIINVLHTFANLYKENLNIKRHVDIHVVAGLNISKIPKLSNIHLNIARFFARTEFVLFLAQDTWPSPMAKDHLKQHKKLLMENDILVLPAFSFTEFADNYDFPNTVDELIHLVQLNIMGIYDKGWPLNKGPTDYEKWIDMVLYNVSFGYDSIYQPNFVVKRGREIPWCTERFDTFEKSKAACLLQMYFNGAEVWVVPEAFVIQHQYNQVYTLLEQQESRIEKKIYERMYLKFFREACMYYARIIDGLDEWRTPRASHIKQQCPKIISNWGLFSKKIKR
ncbi:15888_t:CDS:2 [Dentiscutata erythropus]|uniref:15888_t:CDS:1 n=1 Tax=Dentiscutata erythropus TaxID=1348616 RepID=A0A9N8VZW9_9GLOM|nr:15888_t:CDS:2 [Dentiscutata erythropus]